MGNSVSVHKPTTTAKSFHALSELDIDKSLVDFSSLKGKEFAELVEKFGDRDFVIMAFPCNQFGHQEPGTNEQIKQFVASRRFKGLLMDKVEVNGKKATPVFDFLKVASGDTSPIAWNFAKFIVRKDGTVHGRFGPRTTPAKLSSDIEACLND